MKKISTVRAFGSEIFKEQKLTIGELSLVHGSRGQSDDPHNGSRKAE
jgi:hypothetical protein